MEVDPWGDLPPVHSLLEWESARQMRVFLRGFFYYSCASSLSPSPWNSLWKILLKYLDQSVLEIIFKILQNIFWVLKHWLIHIYKIRKQYLGLFGFVYFATASTTAHQHPFCGWYGGLCYRHRNFRFHKGRSLCVAYRSCLEQPLWENETRQELVFALRFINTWWWLFCWYTVWGKSGDWRKREWCHSSSRQTQQTHITKFASPSALFFTRHFLPSTPAWSFSPHVAFPVLCALFISQRKSHVVLTIM